jgi:hypothetical protein
MIDVGRATYVARRTVYRKIRSPVECRQGQVSIDVSQTRSSRWIDRDGK